MDGNVPLWFICCSTFGACEQWEFPESALEKVPFKSSSWEHLTTNTCMENRYVAILERWITEWKRAPLIQPGTLVYDLVTKKMFSLHDLSAGASQRHYARYFQQLWHGTVWHERLSFRQHWAPRHREIQHSSLQIVFVLFTESSINVSHC